MFNKHNLRAFVIFLISNAVYYGISVHLYLNVSQHWIWALYLSPIFFVFVTIFSIFYSIIANEKQTRTESEEEFCITIVLLTIMIIWWPLFLIIYLQVYNDILIDFQPNSGILTSQTNIIYQGENYTMLIFNLSSSDEQGYGCFSNNNQISITGTPLPYKYYDLEDYKLDKLPSWFCSGYDTEISTNFYTSKDLQKFNYKIVIFQYPNYIQQSLWIGFIATIFQLSCIFSSLLIMALLIIIDQKPIISIIRKPSRKRRIMAFISSFLLFIFTISCNNIIITATSLSIGLLFFIWSCFSKIHDHFIHLIKGIFQMATTKMLLLPIIGISIIFIILYGIFALLASVCIFHFKIFLCRHFVALWLGQNEEPLENYDKTINIFTIVTWIWNIILLILLFTLEIESLPLMIISIILCILQLSLIIIVLFKTSCFNLISQPWKIYYSNYKIIQQQTDHDQVEEKENKRRNSQGSHSSPMEINQIELSMDKKQ